MNHRPAHSIVSAVLLVFLLNSGTVTAQDTPLTSTNDRSVEQLRFQAVALKKSGQFLEAVPYWYRILTIDRGHIEARREMQECLRRGLQAQRYRDPAFQNQVMELSQADVMALYAEVLVKVSSRYVDADKATVSLLFRRGLEEFLVALNEKSFTDQHVKGVDPTAISRFRSDIQKAWNGRDVKTVRQAVEVLAEIASAGKRRLSTLNVNAVVFEFICGACNSLDEYSSYISDRSQFGEADATIRDSVAMQVLEGNVAHLKITHFQPSTPQEVDDALKSAVMQDCRAIVLDLRGNTGGLLIAAVKTAERFLPSGVIVTAQGQTDDFTKTYTSSAGTTASAIPLTVLVDQETASAAEVLAAALKDHQRAKLVGSATFGKGTLQNVVTFTTAQETDIMGRPRPRAGVRVTSARLLAPSGSPITAAGIAPDILETDRERQFEVAVEHARMAARSRSMMNGTPFMMMR